MYLVTLAALDSWAAAMHITWKKYYVAVLPHSLFLIIKAWVHLTALRTWIPCVLLRYHIDVD
jgi:hypothetical protein